MLRILVLIALAGFGSAQSRPNVVLVMTDDQGIGDFSHAGHGVLETPNLDLLAASSPKVARFYVSPVCSPTRASLLTGRYNYRTRVVDTWIGRSMMEPEEVTLAEILGAAGYATGIFGKWHLGDCYPLRPIDQGFEEALVHRGGGLAQPSEPPANERRYTDAILVHNGVEVETEGYCTDVYFDAALEFIDESLEAERPFFAYVATNAPHDPFHDVPPELYAKYAGRELEPTLRGKSDKVDREARICAMVENIDQGVGRLLEHLEELGIADDTIVVFLNDNGPLWGRFTKGLRGHKTGVYEGGIRAPLFVRWPGGALARDRGPPHRGPHRPLANAAGRHRGPDPRGATARRAQPAPTAAGRRGRLATAPDLLADASRQHPPGGAPLRRGRRALEARARLRFREARPHDSLRAVRPEGGPGRGAKPGGREPASHGGAARGVRRVVRGRLEHTPRQLRATAHRRRERPGAGDGTDEAGSQVGGG